jgi:hypothetical protein
MSRVNEQMTMLDRLLPEIPKTLKDLCLLSLKTCLIADSVQAEAISVQCKLPFLASGRKRVSASLVLGYSKLEKL